MTQKNSQNKDIHKVLIIGSGPIIIGRCFSRQLIIPARRHARR